MHRPEPEWSQPPHFDALPTPKLVRSLEQFQLGDGGGPACLIARDAKAFRESSDEMQKLVDAWFAEEREHSRLLGEALKRYGGRPIQSHWSFTAFCASRKMLGVRFELQVLLLTEIVSTAYYRLMRRHTRDLPLKQMCSLILRDESGHVAFHLDRVAARLQEKRNPWWPAQFWICGLLAGTMLWINHAAALKSLGARTSEFYGEIILEISRFLRRLERRTSEYKPTNEALDLSGPWRQSDDVCGEDFFTRARRDRRAYPLAVCEE